MREVCLLKFSDTSRSYDDYTSLRDLLIKAEDYIEISDDEYKTITEIIGKIHLKYSRYRYLLVEKPSIEQFKDDNIAIIDEIKHAGKLAEEQEKKRLEAEKKRQEKAKESLLLRKQKQLEKLKKELGDV